MTQFSPGKGNKYQYIYKLISPVKSSDLLFCDDDITIQFAFDDAAIRFKLHNVSRSYLSVDWDKVAISIQGKYTGVRHASNLYGDTELSGSILLPPLGYIDDIAIPLDHIYNNGERWVELDLLPTNDHNSEDLWELIQKKVDTKVSLSLPLMFGSELKNYEFDFQVDSVKQIQWKDYTPLKRIPAPPNPTHKILGLDNVTTAVIVVGILGFSAFVLSMKKNPPSE